jgi:hypothetical protein
MEERKTQSQNRYSSMQTKPFSETFFLKIIPYQRFHNFWSHGQKKQEFSHLLVKNIVANIVHISSSASMNLF